MRNARRAGELQETPDGRQRRHKTEKALPNEGGRDDEGGPFDKITHLKARSSRGILELFYKRKGRFKGDKCGYCSRALVNKYLPFGPKPPPSELEDLTFVEEMLIAQSSP